jgi:O-antigen ligase
VIVILVVLTILSSRAESVQRLLTAQTSEELRFRIWGPAWNAAQTYAPFGSGLGSFVAVFKIHEPETMLSATYRNHAHNELLELYLVAGVPGILLLLAGAYGFVQAAAALFRVAPGSSRDPQAVLLGRLGGIVLIGLGLASIADYPLRTPAIEALAIVTILWLAAGWETVAYPTADHRQD